jgi:hypothetical protein
MTTLPHDLQDLYLAPVALAIDARIAELGRLDDHALALAIALESDVADWTRELREEAVLRTVSHVTDLHGWTVGWDPRGIRLAHEGHSFVLGVPANVVAYVEGSATTV